MPAIKSGIILVFGDTPVTRCLSICQHMGSGESLDLFTGLISLQGCRSRLEDAAGVWRLSADIAISWLKGQKIAM